MLTGSDSQSRPQAVPPASCLPRCSQGCVVVGTDTEVGKTYHAAALAKYLNDQRCQLKVHSQAIELGVYKPVASGVVCEDQPLLSQSDAWILRQAAGVLHPLERVCPQQFRAPVAPPVAARTEGRLVDESLLLSGLQWWRQHCDFLIIEGAGGVLSPISDQWTFLDFLTEAKLDWPVIIIAANRLGVVNHVLLTVEAVRRRGLPLEAVLLNTLPDPQPANGGEGLRHQAGERSIVVHHAQDYSLETNLELLRQFAPDLRIESQGDPIWRRLWAGLMASREG